MNSRTFSRKECVFLRTSSFSVLLSEKTFFLGKWRERLLLSMVPAAFEGIAFCGGYVLVPMVISQASLICHQASGSPFAEVVVHVFVSFF